MERVDGWMGEYMYGWLCGCMNVYMDNWIDESICECVYLCIDEGVDILRVGWTYGDMNGYVD